jgi:uroporphyrinogen decarboxylase
MTGKERISRILQHKAVDRIGLFEHFWGDTLALWREQGHIQPDEDLSTHFGFDIENQWSFNYKADLNWQDEVVEETEDTITVRDGNGALLRTHKKHNATPEHVAFKVTDREFWELDIKPILGFEPRRINQEAYSKTRRHAADAGCFFFVSGVNIFEAIHPVCGHENLLMGMALDPDWVLDMAMTYADLIIACHEELFAREGEPDGVWFYEDMGFKQRPFMSPDMYRELVMPAHKRVIDFCHGRGLPVIMHSCGFVEPLLPHMIEAGIDALQVMEVKAGMDPLRIKQNFGDRIALCGGLDARNLTANNREAIRAEMEAKIPALMEDSGFILHSDHSVPTTTEYETYRFFVDEGLRLGTY